MITTHHKLIGKTAIFSDEALSSWINRLARDNLCSPYLFCSRYLGQTLINRDIDRAISNTALLKIAELTSEPIHTIQQLQIPQYYNSGIKKKKTLLHEQLSLHCHIKGFKRLNRWIQFCPICLKENNYYRRYWRFALCTTCFLHNTVLQDACPNCLKPINFFNIHLLHSSKAICEHCLFDLTQSECDIVILNDVISFDKALVEAINSGWVMWRNFNLHAFPFISGVIYLINGIRKSLFHCIDNNSHPLLNKPFGQLNTITRHQITQILASLLKNWPYELTQLKEGNIISQTAFYKDSQHDWPFWIWKVMRSELNKGTYWLRSDEIESAIAFLQKNKYQISPSNVGEVLGRDRSFYVNAKNKRLIENAMQVQQWKKKIFHW
ncbi:TniQ family protein [Pseudoalteromonas luteoviolacea]|uniref:TniQ family protein n=1 Tax=Pseudoalteromonas luteoviolacea TaxID=43657 RepID=UPI001F2A769D|nr:TniQ family protein [Pseudoalteromonas luteoviolacea]MCF6441047.1 TniQ family protein [Pseudoalteromonas luteoviolacea]